MEFARSTSKLDLAGKILIVPIVSTANVSQLAVDLLIVSLGLRRQAVINPDYFIPLVGGTEDDEPGITTPSELYGKDGIQVVVIQQRSPILKAKKQEYIDHFLKFIQESGVAAVLFLAGVDLSNRTDDQMLTPIYQLQPVNTPPLNSSPLQALTTLPIPVYQSPVPQKPGAEDTEPLVPFIPGAGLTRRILSSIPKAWSVPTAALLRFALDGDNREDALSFATVTAKIAGIQPTGVEWRQPKSWTGLFGTPHDQTLYG
ncbi:hypothetical protein K435DRAFT_755914 [Dendrothele bispora CBS 962.96]|uniref:Proteasome assembly chaperone 2 n=1 Tax=Dendrothele bispora (strain CBS 962.96) TaxID=1314807 RepID=A0A4S8M056_DENBC|nr:hypothetical protein K435DRAFT_755914 [Dendrothele bispora CBS 962.96]